MYHQLTTLSAYSLLQSTIKIPHYIATAKKAGYKVLGLTDHNVLYGALEFYQQCQNAGIKPVIGVLFDCTFGESSGTFPLYLFAKNLAGYRLLMRLSSEKMINGHLDLAEYLTLPDLFGILPQGQGFVPEYSEDSALLSQVLTEFVARFDQESLFLGVQKATDTPEKEWFQQHGIQLCAYRPIAALEKEELFAVQVMEHIKNGTQIEDFRKAKEQTSAVYYLESPEELLQAFGEKSEALLNNQRIAEECSLTIPLHQRLLPHFPLEKEENAADFLRKLCFEKLPQRIPHVTETYRQRLDYELSVIHTMGFDDYFLIIWDVMDFAHKNEIVTGAGRGSAAGSLVAFVLAITDVDPIAYDLLFERFLNPERYTMPDIDLDIPDNRRDEILHYVRQKYGQEYMAQIATFGTMAAKMVLRDVSRVFGLSQSEANRWSKAIPNALKMTLALAYEQSNQLRELATFNERNETMFAVAKVLEGLPRHVSTHAAGVVISDQNLLDLVPLQQGSDEILLTQFTMNDVETVGLLKMDFLGLRNLSIIDNTLKGIKRVSNETVTQKAIPLDDPAVLRLFQQGDTAGIFQFESAGIRNVLRKLGPESIEDIAAVNALYRPGPMQNIDTFIRRKKGQEKVVYPDATLVPILQNTYGIIVYQEQIMQVASKMAGFSLGQADILRRAISKKKKDVLDEERRHFVEGAVANHFSAEKAEEVYDYIERFANYGFNRSHAFAYSFIGFQMAYLKVHYPGPFFAALLHSVRNNPSKLKEYLNEATRYGVAILPPSINKSGYSFYLQSTQQIRFGFSSVKGIRRDLIQDILDERKENGAFSSLDQFLLRLHQKNTKWLKEDYLRPLLSIGAFDELVVNRKQAIIQLEGKIQNIAYSGGSLDLLETMALKEAEVADYDLEQKLALEEEYLGVYLSGHPVQQYQKLQQLKQTIAIADLVPNERVRILFYVRHIREIRTKKGEQMAFLEGTDASKEVSITVFPILYRQVRGDVAENAVLYVEGKVEVSRYNGEIQLIADKIELAEKAQAQLTDQTCFLKITPAVEKDHLQELSQLLRKHKGQIPVVLFYERNGKKVLLTEENWVKKDEEIESRLGSLLGTENVIFK
jgi:DNA polymerase-3 subunit alpha